jgi:hypothetical protein
MTTARTRYEAPSARMVSYMRALATDRVIPELGVTGEERLATLERWLAERTYDKFGFMTYIDAWRQAPRDVVTPADGLVPGVYRHNGTIYVVKLNQRQTGMYAKRLVEIGGRRLTEADTVVQIEFEYDRDALRHLRPADQMSLEEARPFIIRYGRCIFCNTVLSDAKSVARGVGPVCIRRYRPTPEEQAAAQAPAEVTPGITSGLARLIAQLEGSA